MKNATVREIRNDKKVKVDGKKVVRIVTSLLLPPVETVLLTVEMVKDRKERKARLKEQQEEEIRNRVMNNKKKVKQRRSPNMDSFLSQNLHTPLWKGGHYIWHTTKRGKRNRTLL